MLSPCTHVNVGQKRNWPVGADVGGAVGAVVGVVVGAVEGGTVGDDEGGCDGDPDGVVVGASLGDNDNITLGQSIPAVWLHNNVHFPEQYKFNPLQAFCVPQSMVQ